MKNFRVLATGKVDGGAYRWVELPDGSGRVEEWRGDKWIPGGASFAEVADAPPVSERFAAELGIPASDITTAPPRSQAELDDRESEVMLETLDRLIEERRRLNRVRTDAELDDRESEVMEAMFAAKRRRRRSSKLNANELREAIRLSARISPARNPNRCGEIWRLGIGGLRRNWRRETRPPSKISVAWWLTIASSGNRSKSLTKSRIASRVIARPSVVYDGPLYAPLYGMYSDTRCSDTHCNECHERSSAPSSAAAF